VLTLHDAAGLLAASNSLVTLAPLAAAIGCAGDPAPLDEDALRALGIARDVDEARIATGPGALRALLVSLAERTPLRERLPRLAAHLSARAPHVLWIVVATQPSADHVAIAAWSGVRRPPRVAALIAHRQRLVDSDAETVRALAAAAGARDVLTHARWVEVLGREALTARFYRALDAAIEGMAQSSCAAGHDVRRELALLDASRLLFLSFLEAKGWLNRDHAFLTGAFERCLEGGGGFRERVLRPLFFGTLNTPPAKRATAARRFGQVPFLNGGLFSNTALERCWNTLVFSDDAYGALLFDVFGQFRFTAHEETASWNEAAVDPEMLGKSFESLMASRERRRTGAFFTPFALVERVAHCGLEAVKPASLADLRNMSVLDPACGSGAFLVHILERLGERAKSLGDDRPVAVVRREVLTRSIFGVDVNPAAVWLCQLRLWLSVVIESDETDPGRVLPLPNLDRNIRVGDALAGRDFSRRHVGRPGAASVRRLRERYARATGSRKESLARELDRVERRQALLAIEEELDTIASRRRDLVVARRGRDLFGARYRPSPGEQEAAVRLRRLAADLRSQRAMITRGGALPFSFGTHFADIAARGGFTLVLTNPPWVRLHRIPADQRASFRRDFIVARRAAWLAGAEAAGAASGFAGQVDLASLFVERCAALMSPVGAMALLVPAKLWRSLAGGGVRHLVASNLELLCIEDYSEAPAVFDAAVYPSLVVTRRPRDATHAQTEVSIAAHHGGHDPFRWRSPASNVPLDDSPGAPWLLLPPDVRRAFDLLRRAGSPLGLSVFGRPLLGVKCGCNDAFLVELLDIRDDVADVVTSTGRAITVERSLVRPLIRGESLRPWAIPESYHAILWTHDDTGSALPRLPRLTADWLSRWRHALLSRSDARHKGQWWSLFRIESARSDRPRVVWADVGKALRASVLPMGDARVPLNSCYVARCRDECDAHALTALLNGPLARAWLNVLAEPARGGYHRYLGWTLALLPLPTRWDFVRDTLANLGRRAATTGEHVSEIELLDAAVGAYDIAHQEIAPLVAWSGA
jgi:SAM-dependent methyltransferase